MGAEEKMGRNEKAIDEALAAIAPFVDSSGNVRIEVGKLAAKLNLSGLRTRTLLDSMVEARLLTRNTYYGTYGLTSHGRRRIVDKNLDR